MNHLMTAPANHPAFLDEKALLKYCNVRRLRRSGPGGQHRNKVETAVVLHHRSTGVEAEANERRSQAANQKVAIFRLRTNLALYVRSGIDANRVAEELWNSRCRDGKVKINPEHVDFPAVLAYVLDVLAVLEWDVKGATARLGCTSSQLIKLLKLEPRAFSLVNRERAELGLHLLK